jgi:16S rRNA (uracil1498-N3)-methyltransferase
MNHFFLPPSAISNEGVTFPPDISAQIANVLRLRSGAQVLVLDNQGLAYEVELQSVASRLVIGQVQHKFAALNEPQTHLTLQISLTQREKFEWILQKGTELGVSEFVPLITARTLVQNADEVKSKMERWQRILREAAEQCERGRVPILHPPKALKNEMKVDAETLSILLYEDEQQKSLKTVLEENLHRKGIRILVGPEGGFTEAEVATIIGAGYQSVTLGPRILRMETAAIAAAAIVMYTSGEMGRQLT